MALAANRAGSASSRRLAYLASFILFIALCASIAYWAMQMFAPPARPVAPPPVAQAAPVDVDAAASLFGAKADKTAVASNYQLKGLVLASNLANSVVIMSRDGKPAEAFPAGREIAPGVKVKEVHPGYVVLDEKGVQKRVELPADLVKTASADRTQPPVRTSSAPPRYTPPTMAPPATPAAQPPQQVQPPQSLTAPAQPVQSVAPVAPGTPVPANQAPALPSSGASTAATQAAGAGTPASPAQGAVVVQSPPTPSVPVSGGAVTQAQQSGAVQPGQPAATASSAQPR